MQELRGVVKYILALTRSSFCVRPNVSFIGNDQRLLPSGVRPPRFFAFNTGGRGIATLVFLAIRGEFVPPKNRVLSPHAAAQVLFRKVIVLRAGCPNSR
jgi:hypothetical protein